MQEIRENQELGQMQTPPVGFQFHSLTLYQSAAAFVITTQNRIAVREETEGEGLGRSGNISKARMPPNAGFKQY